MAAAQHLVDGPRRARNGRGTGWRRGRSVLDLAEVVARHEHGPALVAERTQQLADLLDPGRIEAVGRFVEDQQLGVLEERLGQAEPLAHPEGVGPDEVVGSLGQPHPVQCLVDGLGSDAVDPAEEARGCAARSSSGTGPGSRRSRRPCRSRGRRRAGVGTLEDAAGPGRRSGQPEQAADRRRLARPVRAQEPEHPTRRDLEVEAVDRHLRPAPQAAVLLAQARDLDHRCHGPIIGAVRPEIVTARAGTAGFVACAGAMAYNLRGRWRVAAGAGLAVAVLGAPRIERDGPLVRFDTRKAVALLGYLAIDGRPHRRETLAALLWPDADETRARSALRRTLSVSASSSATRARPSRGTRWRSCPAPGSRSTCGRSSPAAGPTTSRRWRARRPCGVATCSPGSAFGTAPRSTSGSAGGRAPASGRWPRPGPTRRCPGGRRRARRRPRSRRAVAGARPVARACPPRADAAARAPRGSGRGRPPVPPLRSHRRRGARCGTAGGDDSPVRRHRRRCVGRRRPWRRRRRRRARWCVGRYPLTGAPTRSPGSTPRSVQAGSWSSRASRAWARPASSRRSSPGRPRPP